MKSNSILLWSLGVNGEGSARVTFSFIKCICSDYKPNTHTTILYSSGSTLDQLISSTSMPILSPGRNPNVRFIRLPKFTRNYLIHFLLKFFGGPFLFFKTVVVFDDFPFKFLRRQVLYFHQPNLIHSNSKLWFIKRLCFRLLLSPSLIVYIQTKHMRDSFLLKFGPTKSICFLHDLGR